MTDARTDGERDLFERWVDGLLVDGDGFSKRHRYQDGYCQNELNSQWKSWRARAALPRKGRTCTTP